MKRTDALVLTAVGATFAFSSFGRETTGGSFKDQPSCVDAGFSASICSGAYANALRLHREKAPRFRSREECVAATDAACVEAPAEAGVAARRFMPAMSGFSVEKSKCDPQQPSCRQQSGGGGGGGSSAFLRGGRDWYSSGPYYDSQEKPGSARGLSAYAERPSADAAYRRSFSPAGQAPRIYALAEPNIRTNTVSRGGFGWRGFRGSGRA